MKKQIAIRTRKGGSKGSRAPASSRPLAPSPPRPLDLSAPGPGSWVVLYLRDPREKAFGRLLRSEAAGVWLRGIELESLEAWARERARGASSSLGPSTFFVPFLRVEKIVEDEPMGPVPSLRDRFEAIAGRTLDECLG